MKNSLILLFVIVLLGCSKKSDPTPTQLLTNTDMESGQTAPNAWSSRSTGGNSYVENWATQAFSSANHSLAIASTAQDPNNFAYWTQTYQGPISGGKTIILTVKIKGVNVSGYGAAISLRGDTENSSVSFSTTQNLSSITGTFDWTTYQVKLSNIDSSVKYIRVYLIMLTGTSGTLYFDDASLT